MKISLLLPTLGERDYELERLLNSLIEQEYKDFEVIIISQANHDKVKEIVHTFNQLSIIHDCLYSQSGLSLARNRGLELCSGDIIMLSDDDCWYPRESLSTILQEFKINPQLDVLLTQIFDYDQNILYKKYSKEESRIINKYNLMSRSSIEIAFKRRTCNKRFDEEFGLGAKYKCGEEADFLLSLFSATKEYRYVPKITVYHPRKNNVYNKERIIAKGALYSKHFNIAISHIVLLRDLLVKKQNNYYHFFKGFKSYKKKF
jgi:Glycosyltransferases involved in cell wall biogenesis